MPLYPKSLSGERLPTGPTEDYQGLLGSIRPGCFGVWEARTCTLLPGDPKHAVGVHPEAQELQKTSHLGFSCKTSLGHEMFTSDSSLQTAKRGTANFVKAPGAKDLGTIILLSCSAEQHSNKGGMWEVAETSISHMGEAYVGTRILFKEHHLGASCAAGLRLAHLQRRTEQSHREGTSLATALSF